MQLIHTNALRVFRRIREFAAAQRMNPMSTRLAPHIAVLDDVIQVMSQAQEEHAALERISRQETQLQLSLRAALWSEHVLPVAGIAREVLGAQAWLAVRLPGKSASHDHLVHAALLVAEASVPHEDRFVAEGLPGDFIEQLRAAAQRMQDAMSARIETNRRRMTAMAILGAELRRGRCATRKISALIAPALQRDAALKAAWLSAKGSSTPRKVRSSMADAEHPDIARVA